MKRTPFVSVFLLLLLAGIGTAVAQDNAQCFAPESERINRIAACTALIDAPSTPDSVRMSAHLSRAAMRYSDAQYEEAIKDFSIAIGFDPSNAEAFHGRGLAHLRRSEYVEAISDFGATIRLRPGMALFLLPAGTAAGQ